MFVPEANDPGGEDAGNRKIHLYPDGVREAGKRAEEKSDAGRHESRE